MISFACKTVDLRDIVMCSFELTKTEYDTLMFLLQQSEAISIQEIGNRMHLERSTVQKAIAKLMKRDLLVRKQVNITGGGYRFIYGVADKQVLKDRLGKIVEGWYTNVVDEISSW